LRAFSGSFSFFILFLLVPRVFRIPLLSRYLRVNRAQPNGHPPYRSLYPKKIRARASVWITAVVDEPVLFSLSIGIL
jgi:hypothetical protein